MQNRLTRSFGYLGPIYTCDYSSGREGLTDHLQKQMQTQMKNDKKQNN